MNKAKTTIIQFTFALDEPDIEDEYKLKFAQKLLPELRNLDEVERADRAEDLNPGAGAKPGFATLIGVLSAEVSIKNIKGFVGFLSERLQDKPIKLVVKLGEKEVSINVKSTQELAVVEQTVMNLMAAMESGKNG
jgi:hypothetical protein